MRPLPAIPGTEISGTIEAVGHGVKGLKPGQRAVVSVRERPHRGGCYAEYNATAASSVFLLPEGVDMEAAAALANYQVADHLLRDCARPMKGQSVLVYAAAGGVGSAVLDLARAQGLDVIAVCSGLKKIALMREAGLCAAIPVFSIHIFDHWPQKRRDGMVWLIDALAKGIIRPRIYGSLKLAEARRAHELLAGGEILGKLLLKP